MKIMRGKIILFCWVFMFCNALTAQQSPANPEQHIGVSMRLIGHELLSSAGDTTSLVLPIEKIEGRYKISFESEFYFDAATSVIVTNEVMKNSDVSNHYIMEVEDCASGEIVYSFEMLEDDDMSLLPCGSRPQNKGCYFVYLTLLDRPDIAAWEATEAKRKVTEAESTSVIVLILAFMVLAVLAFIYWKRRSKTDENPEANSHIISIGDYVFDQRNMRLSRENESIELTSKEADLLHLLHASVNMTIEREVILNKVWGDEGDYVGRTLDVFISKLRKKLVADPNIKIANIRGVGYKMVLND